MKKQFLVLLIIIAFAFSCAAPAQQEPTIKGDDVLLKDLAEDEMIIMGKIDIVPFDKAGKDFKKLQDMKNKYDGIFVLAHRDYNTKKFTKEDLSNAEIIAVKTGRTFYIQAKNKPVLLVVYKLQDEKYPFYITFEPQKGDKAIYIGEILIHLKDEFRSFRKLEHNYNYKEAKVEFDNKFSGQIQLKNIKDQFEVKKKEKDNDEW